MWILKASHRSPELAWAVVYAVCVRRGKRKEIKVFFCVKREREDRRQFRNLISSERTNTSREREWTQPKIYFNFVEREKSHEREKNALRNGTNFSHFSAPHRPLVRLKLCRVLASKVLQSERRKGREDDAELDEHANSFFSLWCFTLMSLRHSQLRSFFSSFVMMAAQIKSHKKISCWRISFSLFHGIEDWEN